MAWLARGGVLELAANVNAYIDCAERGNRAGGAHGPVRSEHAARTAMMTMSGPWLWGPAIRVIPASSPWRVPILVLSAEFGGGMTLLTSASYAESCVQVWSRSSQLGQSGESAGCAGSVLSIGFEGRAKTQMGSFGDVSNEFDPVNEASQTSSLAAH